MAHAPPPSAVPSGDAGGSGGGGGGGGGGGVDDDSIEDITGKIAALAFGRMRGDDWDPIEASGRVDASAPPAPMCARRVMGELRELMRCAGEEDGVVLPASGRLCSRVVSGL